MHLYQAGRNEESRSWLKHAIETRERASEASTLIPLAAALANATHGDERHSMLCRLIEFYGLNGEFEESLQSASEAESMENVDSTNWRARRLLGPVWNESASREAGRSKQTAGSC